MFSRFRDLFASIHRPAHGRTSAVVHPFVHIVLVIALFSGLLTLPSAPPVAAESGAQLYWGALVQGKVPTSTNLQPGGVFDQLEQRAAKKMAIIHFGQPWMMNGTLQAFQPSWFSNVRAHGSIPMLNWASWQLGSGSTQPDFQLRDIYSGTYDTFIAQWARDAKAWGHPFFLRFNHEMNGWWYPWAEGKTSSGAIVNGNSSGDYVKAWRHVHALFQAVGATNVTWVWCTNQVGSRTAPLSGLYPGDDYVDWVGLDPYNGSSDKAASWQSFSELLLGSSKNPYNTYGQLQQLAPAKPIMIAEVGTSEDGGPLGKPASKAAWISDAIAVQIPVKFPRIKAVVWFNWNSGNSAYDWPIETSQLAVDSFADAIASKRYAASDYATLMTKPIPPPSALPPAKTYRVYLSIVARR